MDKGLKKHSNELQMMALELAGVQIPGSLKRAISLSYLDDQTMVRDRAELLTEATNLKREGNGAEESVKFLLYTRSGLRYLEYLATAEKHTDSDVNLFGETAVMLEYSAHQALRAAKRMKTPPMELRILSCVCYRLAALARMNKFYISSDKLQKCVAQINQTAERRAKAQRLAKANAAPSSRSSSQFFIDEKEEKLDAEYRDYVYQSSNDSIQAMHNLRLADAGQREAIALDTTYDKKFKMLPDIDIMCFRTDELESLVRAIRGALNMMYK